MHFSGPNSLLVHGSIEPSVNEFLEHPDFRQIAAFFLGWLSIYSVSSIILSPVTDDLSRWFRSFVVHRSFGCLPVTGMLVRPVISMRRRRGSSYFDTSTSSFRSREAHDHLVLLLFLCFAFASIANFCSLLTFSSGNGGATCAFVVALGGISAICARLFGLVTLSYELQRLGVRGLEFYISWFWIIVSIAFAFAEYATNVGVTEQIPQLGTTVCYRVRYLPTSLTTSLVYLTLEFYILFRLLSMLAPAFLELRHRMGAIWDTRVLRVVSLIALELLVIVPNIMFIGLVGEFVPFSLGALLVVAAFNKPLLDRAHPADVASLPPLSVSGPVSPVASTLKSQGLSFHALDSSYTSSVVRIGPSALRTRASSSRSSLTSNSTTSSLATVTARVTSTLRPMRSGHMLPRESRDIVQRPSTLALSPHAGDSHGHEILQETNVDSRPFRQRILSHQNEFAKRLEEQEELKHCRRLPLPPRLNVAIPVEPLGVTHPDSHLRSSDTVVYGSDIIRAYGGDEAGNHHSSPNTVNSGPTWVSTLRASSIDSRPCSLGRQDRWLTFGDCSSSPTRRKTFSDRSLESARYVASPTEMSYAHFRSSRLMHRGTFGEHLLDTSGHPATRRLSQCSGSRAAEKTAKTHELPTTGLFDSLGTGKVKRVRIRGPRPLPRVFSPTCGSATGT